MKKTNKSMLIVFFLGIAVVVALVGFYFFRPKNQPISFISPSGQKMFVASINRNSSDQTKNGNIKFTIKDRSSGRILSEIITNASARLNWSARWINDQKIELNSSDTGTYCWQEEENIWIEAGC